MNLREQNRHGREIAEFVPLFDGNKLCMNIVFVVLRNMWYFIVYIDDGKLRFVWGLRTTAGTLMIVRRPMIYRILVAFRQRPSTV